MNKIQKLLRLFQYRNRKIFGSIGVGNFFAKDSYIDDNAVVGNNNYFGTRCMILYADIGNYCSIAPHVIIAPANHSIDFITTANVIVNRINSYSFDLFQSRAVIGNDVWIGANVVIAQGVKIGNGAVVGANSFVNKDIPPYAIAVGSPAKVIRYRFSDDLQKLISESKWWDMELDEAVKTVERISQEYPEFKKNELEER